MFLSIPILFIQIFFQIFINLIKLKIQHVNIWQVLFNRFFFFTSLPGLVRILNKNIKIYTRSAHTQIHEREKIQQNMKTYTLLLLMLFAFFAVLIFDLEFIMRRLSY